MAEEGRQMVKLEKWAGLAGHGKELGSPSDRESIRGFQTA